MKTYKVRGTHTPYEVPSFFYGTAWKEEKTTELTFNALSAGFRAIDTANQRKHYYEKGAGQGIAQFLKNSPISRNDLWLQTKYTYERGQDHRLPYDPNASHSAQVRSSFESSLENLQTDYLDSYVLHGPFLYKGISEEDLEVWAAMEKLVATSQVRLLGVSNFLPEQLKKLIEATEIKPSFVQNRCFASTGWDMEMRKLCEKHEILYQGFSLLTANRNELSNVSVSDIANHHSKTVAQVVFRFAQQLGMITLTGTSQESHMATDLAIDDFELCQEEMDQLERIGL